jgi:hypothetical protein
LKYQPPASPHAAGQAMIRNDTTDARMAVTTKTVPGHGRPEIDLVKEWRQCIARSGTLRTAQHDIKRGGSRRVHLIALTCRLGGVSLHEHS